MNEPPDRPQIGSLPRGLVGALGGGIGALPLLPLAAALGSSYALAPDLPGVELLAGDRKLATYAEAGALVLAVPFFALLFGELLPRRLERWRASRSVSSEWAGVAFALSFPLAAAGVHEIAALAAGAVAAALVVLGILGLGRSSSPPRQVFGRESRQALALIVMAGASLDLARRSGIGSLVTPIPALLLEMAIAGTSLALILTVACLALTREPGLRLARAGDAAWLALVMAAAAIAFPSSSGALWVLGVVAWLLGAVVRPAPRAAVVGTRAALLLLFVVCAWRRFDPPWFDYLETGCSLSPVQSYQAGARPYVDVVPIHGWGSDGGFDAFLFRYVGATVRTFLLRESAGSVLALVLFIGYAVAALGPACGGLAAILALCICPFFFARQMLAFAALAFLAGAVATRSRRAAFVAGAIGALEIFYSLDFGMVVFAGAFLGLGILLVLDRGQSVDPPAAVPRTALSFAIGALGGAAPFLIRLAAYGSVGSFLRSSFVETPRWNETVWGLPVGRLWTALSAGLPGSVYPQVQPVFFVLVLAVAAATLLLRRASGRWESGDRVTVVALGAAIAALRPMLGRVDGPHLARYGVFAAVPLAWLFLRAWRSGPARLLLSGALALGVAASIHPFRALQAHFETVESAARRKGAEVPLPIPRSGGASLPDYQVESLVAFRGYIDANLRPGETFFDFANQPTLYFIADRRPPIRFMTVAQYESQDLQLEVIGALEREKPPVVILPAGLYGNLDSVSNERRAPRVAKYVREHYEPDVKVGGAWLMGRRKASSP